MQNYDYSKQIKLDNRKHISQNETRISLHSYSSYNQQPASAEGTGKSSIMNLISGKSHPQSQPLSFIYLFVGAVLFFTSGLVVGMKIDQKESLFAKNEVNTFKNVGQSEKPAFSPPGAETALEEEKEQIEPRKKLSPNETSVPTGLKFPPRADSLNFIIQVGQFSKEDANKWGRFLIRKKQSFQGRLLRTSSGKLYLGYYYSANKARRILKMLKTMEEAPFENASIKKVRF
ncbi:MAG: hypothetical protein H7A25_05665 [Leptospiraceae bacterium]|nr:hypothetical protein [Leptospiraceae bacterium]MCP5499368.1 hypothetical protein [Leptospiraceae bacterium]